MPDSTPPFRPKPQPPGEHSLAAVRAQITALRRRANAWVLQHALYLIASLFLLGFSLLLVFALELSRASFAIAVWSALAALLVLAPTAALLASRRWIRGRDVALTIDRRAALEERLATLASTSEEGSRLWGVLLDQNVRLLPRWEPTTMVPRAVPRSLWLLVLAAAVTLFALRWSTAPGRQPMRGRGGSGIAGEGLDVQGAPSAEAVEGAEGLPSEGASLLASLPERLRAALLGAEPGERQRATGDARGEKGGVPAGGAARSGPNQPGEPQIGTSFPAAGADVPASEGPGAERRRAPGQGQPRRGPGDPAQGEGLKSLPPVEAGRARALTQNTAPRGRTAGGSGGGKRASGGRGGNGDGLFGSREEAGKPAGSFDLDLEGKQLDAGGTPAGDEGAARTESDLAADQRLDDAIRRAQVPPEYERIVQQVFNHPDATETETGLGSR